MDFSGKTVLITGATGLIGSTLAETFSQAGAEVVSAVRDVSRARGRAVAIPWPIPPTPRGSCAPTSPAP